MLKQENAERFRNLLTAVYGPNAPLQCRARLEAEILEFSKPLVDEIDLTLELKKAAREQGCIIDIKADYGASLIYFLTGCSNINPLQPHYFCPVCKRTVFVDTVEDGWDLPVRYCCGSAPMMREGHAIPLEIIKEHANDEKPSTEYYVPESFMPMAKHVVQSYYGDKWLVVPYLTELERDGEAIVNDKYRIVSSIPPDHPELHLVLLPPESGMPELDENGIWQTTFQTFRDNDYRKIIFSRSTNNEILADLSAKHSLLPAISDLLNESVFEMVSDMLDEYIQEMDCIHPLEDNLTFSTLLRKEAFLHDKRIEDNPAMQNDGVRFSDFFSCREDVWKLLDNTIPMETDSRQVLIERITDRARKGMFAEGRMSQATEQMLRDFGISEHWILQMKHIRYLRPKASLINETLNNLYYMWFMMQDSTNGDNIEEESPDDDSIPFAS